MLFVDTFSVPAGTAKATPVTRDLNVARGIILLVEVSFLDGPEDEVNVILRQALHQLVPTNPEAAVVGNSITVQAHLFYPIEEAPFKLQIDAWSPDATYPHEVSVRVHIMPRELLAPPREELGILKRLEGLVFGRR